VTGALELLSVYGGSERVAAAFAAHDLAPDLARALLAARASLFGAGNRRRLFTQFDAILGQEQADGTVAQEGVQTTSESSPGSPQAAQLRGVKMRNWKVFARAEFDFPRLSTDRPVCLIGGKNGYGKTSFLEAILFGLYGQRALLDVDRTLRPDAAGPASARATPYRQLIERAFHEPARARGEEVAAVHLAFDTSDGPLEIERRWYFRADGRSSPEDEVLTLWAGDDLDAVPVPEGEDVQLFYQEEIARRLMPASVAPFFLFDGEQVKRLAERKMADQVRLGIESVLGLHAWRDTISDLRDYARDRGLSDGRAEDYARLSTTADTLEAERENTMAAIVDLEAQLSPLRARRDSLLADIGALGGGTFASMQDLHERRHSLGQQRQHLQAELAQAASHAFALALVGQPLLGRTARTLRRESSQAVAGEGFSADALEALLSAIDADDPPLDAAEREAVHERVRRGWARLANATPSEGRLHHYLDVRLHNRMLERLDSAPAAVAGIQDKVAVLRRLETELATLEAAIVERGTRQQSDQDLREDLRTVSEGIEALEQRRRTLDQTLGRLKSQEAQIAEKLDARRFGRQSDEPAQRRAEIALGVARALEQVIKTVTPTCFESFALAVTRAYKALSHKAVVDRVGIDPDGAVTLVDRQGRDVRNFDLSAGESQIFAMALIAAVADTARCPMPLVIDTPLGRLDPDHRERILEFFTTQPRQTILLSQPDEVNGRYLAQIQHRIAARYRLDHEGGAGGLGGSVAHEGYFPTVAA